MSRFKPIFDSMPCRLFAGAVDAFRIEGVRQDSLVGFSLHGKTAFSCQADGYILSMKFPQLYAEKVRYPDELERLEATGLEWDRTTGFLHVGRRVPRSSPHLSWIEPRSIARGFSLGVSIAEIETASAALSSMTADDYWFDAKLRYGGYDFVRTPISNPRASRITTLFETASGNITIGEALSRCGLDVFHCRSGNTSDDVVDAAIRMGPHERFETFIYEFKLSRPANNEFW